MATQVIGSEGRFRLRGTLVALALAFAILVLRCPGELDLVDARRS